MEINIGTRGSKLALAQAYIVRDLLKENYSGEDKSCTFDGQIKYILVTTHGKAQSKMPVKYFRIKEIPEKFFRIAQDGDGYGES